LTLTFSDIFPLQRPKKDDQRGLCNQYSSCRDDPSWLGAMCECGDGSDPEVWTGHPYNLDTAPGGGGCKSKVQVNVMKTDSVIYVLHRKERDGNCQNGTFQVTAQGMGVGNLNGSDAIDGKRKVPWALHSSEGWLGLSVLGPCR
jgi:hypothetical protein